MTQLAPSPFAAAAADLISRGFHVVPIAPKTASLTGKAPGDRVGSAWWPSKDWPRLKDRFPTAIELEIWSEWNDAGIGIVLGSRVSGRDGEYQVVAVDIDMSDPDAIDDLKRVLPYSPMSKKGRKGLTLFYRADISMRTRQYRVGGKAMLCEILTGNDTRQTVAPPSIHPDTGKPYVWINGSAGTRADQLPILTAEHVSVLEETLVAYGWTPGGAQTDAKPRAAGAAPSSLESPFGDLNAEALASLSTWVEQLPLHDLKNARGGYECVADWRASGSGRPLNERKRNLSIQPVGIKDFGTGETYSAIDLVMRATNVDFSRAYSWLDEALHGPAPVAIIIGDTPPAPIDLDALEPDDPAIFTDWALSTELCFPKGLVGTIAKWICETARRPQPALALAASISIIGTAMGRQYAGPTRVGTHVYVMGLAPTGGGKDHPLQCAKRIMAASGMGGHIGPGEFISSTAAINLLQRMPLSLCVMDEFGAFLARINSRKAGGFEKAVGGLLRTAWGSSFAPMPTPEWAQKRSSLIHAPAMSIFGAATPEEFFASLSGLDTTNGLLNRILIFPSPGRPAAVTPTMDVAAVPPGIIEGLKMIHHACGPLAVSSLNLSDADPSAFMKTCPWGSDGAGEAWSAFAAEIDQRSDGDHEFGAFYSRAAEYAQRLATIHAVGRVGEATAVRMESVEWAIAVTRACFAYSLDAARDFIADSDPQARAQEIVRCLKARKGRATHRELIRALAHKHTSRDVKDSLGSLAEAGRIDVLEQPNAKGRPTIWYRLSR